MIDCIECGLPFNRRKGSNAHLCSSECRFLAKVAVGDPSDCWEWTAGKDRNGYGRMRWENGRSPLAHRFSYELAVGPIPDGLQLDHLCRNTSCVNPDHLEAVTPRENMLRGMSPLAVSYRENVCRRGHSLDDALIENNGGGRRVRRCRQCRRSA